MRSVGSSCAIAKQSHYNSTNSTPKKSTLPVISPGQKNMLVGGAIATGLITLVASVAFSFNKQHSLVADSPPSPSPTVTPSPLPDSSPTPKLPASELRLDRLVPTYDSAAFSPADAFAKCPENKTLYLVGETESFKFAVCRNEAPSHCIVLDKINQNLINLTQSGDGFSDGSYTYEPPRYENGSYGDASLRVDDGNAVIADEKVIELYKLAAQ